MIVSYNSYFIYLFQLIMAEIHINGLNPHVNGSNGVESGEPLSIEQIKARFPEGLVSFYNGLFKIVLPVEKTTPTDQVQTVYDKWQQKYPTEGA